MDRPTGGAHPLHGPLAAARSSSRVEGSGTGEARASDAPALGASATREAAPEEADLKSARTPERASGAGARRVEDLRRDRVQNSMYMYSTVYTI